MPSGFLPNPNFERELIRAAEYRRGLLEAAKPAERAAKNFAPVDEGDYRDSIEVTEVGGEVVLRATDFKANWIEFGSVHNPVSAPLRRGARAAGLRFKGSSK